MRPRLLACELAWTDAAFGAIFPAPRDDSARPALVHGIGEMGPGPYLDGVLAVIPFEQMLGLRLTLWMIALAPLFTIRKLGTIASIDPADRVRVLELLIASPSYLIRQMATGLKAVATLLYSQSKAIRTQMATPLGAGGAREQLVTIRTSETRVKQTRRASHEHAAE